MEKKVTVIKISENRREYLSFILHPPLWDKPYSKIAYIILFAT